VAHLAATWDAERAQLESLCAQIGEATTTLDHWGYAEKRAALIALKTEVMLYEPGHTPRATLAVHLPLRGRLPLGGPSSDAQYVR